MARFLVVEVECLECNMGQSHPTIKLETDDMDEALAAAKKPRYGSDYDRFVVDTVGQLIVAPNERD